MDPAIEEALSATFGPDAAAAEPSEAAPPAPSATLDAVTQTAPPQSTATETVDAATTESDPTPIEETPDLAVQVTDLQSRLEAAETRAAETEETHRRAEYERDQRDAAAKKQVNERLRAYALHQVQERLREPENLDPHEYQALQQQWAQLHAQPHADRATQAESEVERLAAYITVEQLGAHYGLSEDEKQAMTTFPTPQAMEQYASTVQEAKASHEGELATMRQQINDLQLQIAAQGRRESGADTVGSPTGHPTTTKLDELSGDAWMDAWFTQTFPARQG